MREWIRVTTAALAISFVGVGTPLLAQSEHDHDPNGSAGAAGSTAGPAGAMGMGGMMDPAMMMKMHAMMSSMMAGGMMAGMGQGMMPMAGPDMMGASAMAVFDSDGDGSVSPGEMDAGLKGALASYDADKGGTLSLAEFETFHSALIRSLMVDRFQALDDDGDGQLTEAELAAAAKAMGRMMTTQAPQGAPGATPAPGMGTMPGMGNMDQDGN